MCERLQKEVFLRLRYSLLAFGRPRLLTKACRKRIFEPESLLAGYTFKNIIYRVVTLSLQLIILRFHYFWRFFFFFPFQDRSKASLKQAPGRNHKRVLYQPVQCPFKERSFKMISPKLSHLQVIVEDISSYLAAHIKRRVITILNLNKIFRVETVFILPKNTENE